MLKVRKRDLGKWKLKVNTYIKDFSKMMFFTEKGKRYFLMGEFLKVNSKMVKKRVLVVSMIKVVKLFKEVFG